MVLYKKREVYATSLYKFRLATNSLTGNWKPGGERIPHPHHLLFKEARNLKGSF